MTVADDKAKMAAITRDLETLWREMVGTREELHRAIALMKHCTRMRDVGFAHGALATLKDLAKRMDGDLAKLERIRNSP